MLVPRLLTGGIVDQIVAMQAELRSDKFDDLRRYQLARSQHPAGIAQDAQLQGEAKPVVRAAALPDVLEIFVTQRVVPQQIRLGGRQEQERILLPIG
jgi:hypothetical protein